MTPPTIERWRVWSDRAQQWMRDGHWGDRVEWESREQAQRAADEANPHEFGDWRPVHCREVVVDGSTPPDVEWWQVWSDSRGEFKSRGCNKCGERRARFDTLEEAEEFVHAVNDPRGCCGPTDWRPVKVRETVVED